MSSNNQKIIIAEVSNNTIHYKYFPYSSNLWLVQTNNDYSAFSDSEFDLESISLDNPLSVISFVVNKAQYTRVDNIEDLGDLQSSFYFNNLTKTLIIHFENHKPYYYYSSTAIEIGFVLGFFNCNKTISGEWNNVQYAPRLISKLNLKGTIDDLFFGKQKLQSANIKIENSDLKYKNFNIGSGVKKKNGNFVRTLIWTGEDATTANYNDFEVTYQGVIEQISEGKQISIDLRDIRSTLTKNSPSNYLDTSEYTYIKDADKKYLIPELWGICYDIPCLSLNEDVNDVSGITAYIFLICDTSFKTLATDSINEVYINGKATGLTPTVLFNTVQNLAYFSIPAVANFRIDDGTGSFRYENMDKVTIDCNGYLKGSDFKEADGITTTTPTDLLENGMAILREIIRKNYGFDYSSTFYDMTNWELYEDNTNYTYKIGYYLDKLITTQKQIEDISASMLGTFIWNADLKFTFDNDDFVEYEMEIPKHRFYPADYFPTFRQDSKKVLAIIRTGIKREWSNKEGYEWLVDDSNENDALIDYNSTQTKDFKTLINNSIDGLKYSTRALTFVGISKDTFSVLTDWNAKDLKAGQWVKVQADHINNDLLGWVKCQIQEVDPKLDIYMVGLVLRIFGYYKELVTNDETKGITGNEHQQIIVEV